MLGTVFFDFLPEVLEAVEGVAGLSAGEVFAWSFGGILLFFVAEKLLAWHHHHPGKETHSYTNSLMMGDSLHNFLDGMLIAAVFLVEPALGPLAAIAIFLHEIPQEIGDFGALIHGGWSRKNAIMWNLFSASLAILGAVGTFFVAPLIEIEIQLVALAGGAFLYVAIVDLIPVSFKEKKNTALHVVFLVLGAALIWMATSALPIVHL